MCDKNAREYWECWLTKAEDENMSLRESEAENNEWLRERTTEDTLFGKREKINKKKLQRNSIWR